MKLIFYTRVANVTVFESGPVKCEVATLGSFVPTFLKKSSWSSSTDFRNQDAFESHTTSDWLNHPV